MCHKDPLRKLCILYKEEAPFAGLPPFAVLVQDHLEGVAFFVAFAVLVQDHLEGVAFFVAFAVEVLPEVDLNHLADRAACLFKKP